jgi:hypothetical protein
MDLKASYFERVMRVHFRSVNAPPRRKRPSAAWQAIAYGSVITGILVLLGAFADI